MRWNTHRVDELKTRKGETDMTDFDFSNAALNEYELSRREGAMAESKGFSDEQWKVINEAQAEIDAILATDRNEMPPAERFLRIVEVAAVGGAVCYPGPEKATPHDILRAAAQVAKQREMIALIERMASGDESAIEQVADELRSRMEAMGIPPEILDDALIVPVSAEDMQGVFDEMNADSNADDDEQDERADGVNAEKSARMLDRD